mmetsp:Transcript_107900/g.348280  ORF Transcript_107900/g.348280 Transcript_107900/m.348280 type:complete len:206 (+) Transcript_107900:1070-1687(+)
MACSSSFFLSSIWSNWIAQYSFLASSSDCSFFSTSTMSSHILMTLSKVPLLTARLPLRASTRKSKPVFLWAPTRFCALCTIANARARSETALVSTCTKLALPLGSVFLKSSSASSSLRTLMVSANATSSSARVFDRASHSAVLVEQLFSSPARNFLSSAKDAAVSSRSSFSCTILIPSSPTCAVFVSMDAPSALTSFVLAAISSS